LDADRGILRHLSLRFVDDRVERDYQRQGGAESQAGFRVTTAAAAVMWLLAALVIPTGTQIPSDRAIPMCLVMAVVNWAAFLLPRAETLDRQHSIISFLTSVNGLVILWIASTGDVLPGYGISAIMLLFAFGFVARTGFIFAALRSAVLVVGFMAAAILYDGRDSLLVDAFIFGAAVIGTLLALRLLEGSRRRVFYQDIVITQQASALKLEKDRADALLLNVLPEPISARLLAGERTIADAYPDVTVLFADIVGFTELASRLPADEVVGVLGRLFGRFDELVAERGLEKIKTIGDAYMAAAGLPVAAADHAARAAHMALDMIDALAGFNARNGYNLQLRVGINSGAVVAGVVGKRKFIYDLWGDAVNIASRMESHGVAGRVQVTEATRQYLAEPFFFEERGTIAAKGVGELRTWFLTGRNDAQRP
jgi:class 3 adenylate cyclase